MGKSGLVLGKFLPPHQGHVYLVDFARRYAPDLHVVVGTLAGEPIPGELRYQWMQELCPSTNVIHLTDENPQYPTEHPDFWQIWQNSLKRVLPGPVDYVFASEDYGGKLAEILGAEFVPVDPGRHNFPISGSALRQDPFSHWSFIPPCVRPYFLKRVCLFGPESTGKSTLARQLAEHFATAWVPEYARTLLEMTGAPCTPGDIVRIAQGQMAAEGALARQANKLLLCDTDVLTTTIWSEVLFGECPEWIYAAAEGYTYDLYLLCDLDVPWVADPIRYRPEDRQGFFARCQDALAGRQRPYHLLRGSWEERFQTAVAAIKDLFGKG